MVENKKVKKDKKKNRMYFGLVASGLYIGFGFIQLILGLGFGTELSEILLIPPDLIGSMILLIIGVVFAFGIKRIETHIDEGTAYIFIGIILALIFLVIYLLILAANAAEAYLLVNEDFADWVPMDDIRPGIYLAIVPLIGFLVWREKFKLN